MKIHKNTNHFWNMVFKKTQASEQICIKSHQHQSKMLYVTLSANYEDQMIYMKTFWQEKLSIQSYEFNSGNCTNLAFYMLST